MGRFLREWGCHSQSVIGAVVTRAHPGPLGLTSENPEHSSKVRVQPKL
jgi:hypothetical protein